MYLEPTAASLASYAIIYDDALADSTALVFTFKLVPPVGEDATAVEATLPIRAPDAGCARPPRAPAFKT